MKNFIFRSYSSVLVYNLSCQVKRTTALPGLAPAAVISILRCFFTSTYNANEMLAKLTPVWILSSCAALFSNFKWNSLLPASLYWRFSQQNLFCSWFDLLNCIIICPQHTVYLESKVQSRFCIKRCHGLRTYGDRMCAEIAAPMPQIFSCGQLPNLSQNVCVLFS